MSIAVFGFDDCAYQEGLIYHKEYHHNSNYLWRKGKLSLSERLLLCLLCWDLCWLGKQWTCSYNCVFHEFFEENFPEHWPDGTANKHRPETVQTWHQLWAQASLLCWVHSKQRNWSSRSPDQSPEQQIKPNSEERCLNLTFILCTYQPRNLPEAPHECLCIVRAVRFNRFNVLSEGCVSAHYNTLFLSAVARWQLLLQIPTNVKFKLRTSTFKAKLSSTPSFKRGKTILNFTSLANCSDSSI